MLCSVALVVKRVNNQYVEHEYCIARVLLGLLLCSSHSLSPFMFLAVWDQGQPFSITFGPTLDKGKRHSDLQSWIFLWGVNLCCCTKYSLSRFFLGINSATKGLFSRLNAIETVTYSQFSASCNYFQKPKLYSWSDTVLSFLLSSAIWLLQEPDCSACPFVESTSCVRYLKILCSYKMTRCLSCAQK